MRNKIIYYIPVLAALLIGCANRGAGPQGGPKDSIPPQPVRSIPVNGSVNFDGKRVDILFNEYIQLDNVGQNLLISPPQQNPPDIKARGKRVLVVFKDSLRDSTTYTIDFGDAICDFTEKNPHHAFSFAFSTGDKIDTLETRGRVFDAMTLNPMKGIFVGIHADMSDSAFTKMPFLRIARTDSAGFFRIGNIHQGTYRLYGVDDVSRDNRLTPGEALAFHDERVTLPGDSASLASQALFLFRPEQKRLYLQRTLREERHRIRLLFSSEPDSLPSLRVLRPSEVDSAAADSAWVDPSPYIYTAASPQRDTLTLWLTDSAAICIDTLYLEARYRRTDSLYRLEWYTDTLRAIWRAPRLTAKAREALDRKNRNRRLELKTNARKGFELYDTIRLTCSTPLASIERDSIRLYERVMDTVLQPVPFTLLTADSMPLTMQFVAGLKAGSKYELRLDSGALHDVYGVTHIAASYPLQVKTLADYSTIRVKMLRYDPQIRLQILNGKDEVVRELRAQTEGTLFEYLKPDTYYLRMYIDQNGDGRWTTGSWDDKRQPEPVYYFPEKIQTKSNWDFEEEWDYLSRPQTDSKPQELIKASQAKKKK